MEPEDATLDDTNAQFLDEMLAGASNNSFDEFFGIAGIEEDEAGEDEGESEAS
jgi:hypothetical protein